MTDASPPNAGATAPAPDITSAEAFAASLGNSLEQLGAPLTPLQTKVLLPFLRVALEKRDAARAVAAPAKALDDQGRQTLITGLDALAQRYHANPVTADLELLGRVAAMRAVLVPPAAT